MPLDPKEPNRTKDSRKLCPKITAPKLNKQKLLRKKVGVVTNCAHGAPLFLSCLGHLTTMSAVAYP